MKDQVLVSIVIPTHNRKKELKKCISSIIKSSFQNYEIIVVNSFNIELKKKEIFLGKNNKLSIIELGDNYGPSRARLEGALKAKGRWVLFIDDDNIITSSAISQLVNCVRKDRKIAVISPLMYFFHTCKIWFCGADINRITSLPTFYKKPRSYTSFYECGTVHNIYMIKRSIGQKVGWFDKQMFIGYEEYDLICRVKKLKYRIGICPMAISFHDVPNKVEELRLISSKLKAYSTIINRVKVMKRYSNKLDFSIFFLLFYPSIFFYYLYLILKNERFDLLIPHTKGFIEGLRLGLKKTI